MSFLFKFKMDLAAIMVFLVVTMISCADSGGGGSDSNSGSGSDASANTTTCTEGLEGTSIKVGLGTRPVYDWTYPDKKFYYLNVLYTERHGGSSFYTYGSDDYPLPVQHWEANPLVAGDQYRIDIFYDLTDYCSLFFTATAD
jgi:hypothetical protein